MLSDHVQLTGYISHHSFLNIHLIMAFLYDTKDSDSVELIIRLQREEIEALKSDNEEIDLALNLQLEELNMIESLIADRETASESRNERYLDYVALERTLEVAMLRHEATAALLTCTGCESLFTRHQSFKAPCDRHYYCRECLANFFEYTIGDEMLYPPKCCNHEILLKNVKTLLDDKLVARYADKKIEYDTEPTKRTYCSGDNCKTFIPETSIEDEVAICSDCGKRTCTICKEAAHRGDCPKDEDTQSLLELADNEGWQRCYNTKCHRVVALTIGCNHITWVPLQSTIMVDEADLMCRCVCGAEFCYICGARWRTCSCPHFNEEWLMEGVDRPRHAGHRLFQPPQE